MPDLDINTLVNSNGETIQQVKDRMEKEAQQAAADALASVNAQNTEKASAFAVPAICLNILTALNKSLIDISNATLPSAVDRIHASVLQHKIDSYISDFNLALADLPLPQS